MMKSVKRILSVMLTLAMLCCLGVSAFAEGAQYKTTQEFLSMLDTVDGVEYSVEGIVSDTYEKVSISYSGDQSDYTSNIVAYFSEDGEEVQFSMFNMIDFAEEDLGDVLMAVNDLNAQSSGMKIYVDTSDNSVTAEFYLLTTPETAVEIALTGLGFAIGFTDGAYEALADYAI